MRPRRALARSVASVVLVAVVVVGALALAGDVLAGGDPTDGALDRPPASSWGPAGGPGGRERQPGGVPRGVRRRYGDISGQRADLVMLVGIVPATGRVRLLSLPRDLRVEIDGHGRQRLGAAYEYGAPAIIRSVRLLTGLPVHHFVGLDFYGLVLLVHRLGGVAVDLPHPARDRSTGFRAGRGRRLLSGEMALAYARSRSYEERRGARWSPGGWRRPCPHQPPAEPRRGHRRTGRAGRSGRPAAAARRAPRTRDGRPRTAARQARPPAAAGGRLGWQRGVDAAGGGAAVTGGQDLPVPAVPSWQCRLPAAEGTRRLRPARGLPGPCRHHLPRRRP